MRARQQFLQVDKSHGVALRQGARRIRIMNQPLQIEATHQVDQGAADPAETNHGNLAPDDGLRTALQVDLVVDSARALAQFSAIEVDVARAIQKEGGSEFGGSAGHGSGALVMVRRLNRDREKRDFTSPPQCAITRSCGARRSRSSPKAGLSQVVISASVEISSLWNSGFSFADSCLVHWNRPLKRRCCCGEKKDPKSSFPALIRRAGRRMTGPSIAFDSRLLLSFLIS